MLKDILLTTLHQITELEIREEEIMKECIAKKLNRSLNNYESHLENTCKYILSKNPISIIKAVASESKSKVKDDEYDDELWHY